MTHNNRPKCAVSWFKTQLPPASRPPGLLTAKFESPQSRANPKSSQSRRAGFTLIETLVMVTGLGLIMSLMLITFHALGRASQNGRRHQQEAATLLRLDNAFRDDAHTATATDPPLEFAVGPLDHLKFLLPDGTSIEWRQTSSGLDRLRYDDDDIDNDDNGPAQARTPYCDSFQIDGRAAPPALGLTLLHGHIFATVTWPIAEGPASSPASSSIQAHIGRDHPSSEGESP